MYKKLILTTALGLVFFAGESLAEDCNLTYKLQGDTYVVTGASNKTTCTSVNIPKTYQGKPVIRIADDAFAHATSLTSIDIPNSVTSIGSYAFYGTHLTNVTIPNSVTTIGGYSFWNSTLETVVIPDSVTSIGVSAFCETKLTSVTIPNSVTSIGDAAFYHISTLTRLVLPDSVTSIGKSVFFATPLQEIFCSEASVASGECASQASSAGINVSKINFGYYKDDAMNDERVFYLKDENGVWQEAKRESIYEKYVADTGAVYLYDSKGTLKKMRGKQIYTVEEAEEATKNGNSFHVGLTYK